MGAVPNCARRARGRSCCSTGMRRTCQWKWLVPLPLLLPLLLLAGGSAPVAVAVRVPSALSKNMVRNPNFEHHLGVGLFPRNWSRYPNWVPTVFNRSATIYNDGSSPPATASLQYSNGDPKQYQMVSQIVRGAVAGTRSHWRDCHFADALSPSLLKHLHVLKGGGCSKMTVERRRLHVRHALLPPRHNQVQATMEPTLLFCCAPLASTVGRCLNTDMTLEHCTGDL